MASISTRVNNLNWTDISRQLDVEGYAVLPGLLTPAQIRTLTHRIDGPPNLRHVSLAAHDLGHGDLYMFGNDLPEPLAAWRTAFYARLARIADRWNETLAIGYRYPIALEDFLRHNRQAGQVRALSHLNRLDVSGYLALHRQNTGEHVFPLQLVALLSAPDEDFTGGEFVMTEQRPRMQSRPMVLPLRQGDAAIISTAQRPFKGGKGYYRVNLKHAISRVRSGQRIGLELSFHDAP